MTEKSAIRLFFFVTPDITGDFLGSSEFLYNLQKFESANNFITGNFLEIRELH